MRIDNRSVKRLQKAFNQEDRIKVDRFVEIICANVTPNGLTKEEVVGQALELFNQIDANGDTEVHWGEFVAFIIELNHAQDIRRNESDNFQLKPVPDASMRINLQRRAISALACDFSGSLCAVEANSDQLRIHRLRENRLRPLLSVRVTSNFISHQVVAGCHLKSINMAVVASSHRDKFFLSSFTLEGVIGQVEQISTLSGQRILRWHPVSEQLCTVGTGRGDAKGHVISVFKRRPRTGALLETEPRRLVWHHKLITELQFLTHEHLAAASEDGSVSIWNIDTAERIGAVVAHSSGVMALHAKSFVPTDEAAWSSFWTRAKPETVVATLVTAPKPQFGGHISKPLDACAQVWKVSNSYTDVRSTHYLLGHEHPTTFATLVMQGSYALTCDLSGETRLWNASCDYECVQVIQLGCTKVITLQDKIVTLEAMHGKDEMYSLVPAERERSPIIMATLNRTMACVVTVTKREVALWDVRTGERVPVLSIPESDKRDITTACLDDRERKLVIGNEYGELFIYNLMNGALIKELDPHPTHAPVTSSHFCACNKDRLVVTTSWGGAIHISDEADRVGYTASKHSVKLRSIFLGESDDESTCHDVLSSAVSFHLKQIATFAEQRDTSSRPQSPPFQQHFEDFAYVAKKLEIFKEEEPRGLKDQEDEEEEELKSHLENQVHQKGPKETGKRVKEEQVREGLASVAKEKRLGMCKEVESYERPEYPSRPSSSSGAPFEKPETTLTGSTKGVICIWDLEFVRLIGVCRAEPESQFTALAYVNSGITPLLAGIDSVSKTLNLWVVGGEDRHRIFGRIARFQLHAGPTSLCVQGRDELLVGFETGEVVCFGLKSSIPHVKMPVRVTTYRGNRMARQATRVQDIQRSLATTPLDQFSGVVIKSLWVSSPPALSANHTPITVSPGSSVNTLTIIQPEELVLVGNDSGVLRILSAQDGSLRGTLDVFAETISKPLNSLVNLKHSQEDKQAKVRELLPTLAPHIASKFLQRSQSSQSQSLSDPHTSSYQQTRSMTRLDSVKSADTLSTSGTSMSASLQSYGSEGPQTEHQLFDRATAVLFKRLRRLRRQERQDITGSSSPSSSCAGDDHSAHGYEFDEKHWDELGDPAIAAQVHHNDSDGDDDENNGIASRRLLRSRVIDTSTGDGNGKNCSQRKQERRQENALLASLPKTNTSKVKKKRSGAAGANITANNDDDDDDDARSQMSTSTREESCGEARSSQRRLKKQQQPHETKKKNNSNEVSTPTSTNKKNKKQALHGLPGVSKPVSSTSSASRSASAKLPPLR